VSTNKAHKDLIFLKDLFESLADSGEMSTDEIKEELRTGGVDPDAALKRLMGAVEQASADSKKSVLDLAREERLRQQDNFKKTIDSFKNWSKEQLLTKIKEISLQGEMMPAASYRELEEQTEENLRALLEDLEMLRKRGSADSGHE
jgi:hypothetical protein